MSTVFRIYFDGLLTLKTPVRIGTGSSTGVAQSDLPVMRDGRGLPIIPGSSMKGVLRSYVESILWAYQDLFAETLASSQLTDIDDTQLREKLAGKDIDTNLLLNRSRKLVTDPFDSINRNNKGTHDELSSDLLKTWTELWARHDDLPAADLDDLIKASSSYTETIFGAPWLASKFYVRDLPLASDSPVERTIFRNGVAIDRDRRVQQAKMLYEFEAVPAGARFGFRAVLENATPEEIGITALGIRALQKSEVRIGGGSSRGLGIAELQGLSIHRMDIDHLADYLFAEDADAQRGVAMSIEDLKKDFKQFYDALSGGS
jgi:CRISPR/Cas system CSM-associated protein Csm3 (group 7 of RAMP superfamily)